MTLVGAGKGVDVTQELARAAIDFTASSTIHQSALVPR